MSKTLQDAGRICAEALADNFESTANWRRLKAADWPDDLRNVRSAEALEAAAEYVRSLDDPLKSHGINRLVEFGELLANWHNYDVVIPDSSEAASRFFFDNGGVGATERDFERLVLRVFHETLEWWKEQLEEDDANQPPRDLVVFFDDNGVPLWEDDEQ